MIAWADVRATVHAAVTDGVAGLLPPGSVHAFIPLDPALPMAWVGSPINLREADPVTVVAEVSVIVAVDGSDAAQLQALDTLEGAVWSALDGLADGRAVIADGAPIGVGGPSVHTVRVTGEVDVSARSLCTPVPMTLGG